MRQLGEDVGHSYKTPGGLPSQLLEDVSYQLWLESYSNQCGEAYAKLSSTEVDVSND